MLQKVQVSGQCGPQFLVAKQSCLEHRSVELSTRTNMRAHGERPGLSQRSVPHQQSALHDRFKAAALDKIARHVQSLSTSDSVCQLPRIKFRRQNMERGPLERKVVKVGTPEECVSAAG